ncbi:MAG: transposase [Pseudomonadota bacterium]
MRKARFTDEEMVAILRGKARLESHRDFGSNDREPAGVVAKRHKVSEQTIYNWRKKFGALSTDEVRRLKQLEAENTRL